MAKPSPVRRSDRADRTPKTPETPAVSAGSQSEPGKDSLIDARLAIPLDKEGRVLVENMRESSREKLKSLLTNRDLAKDLGLSADGTANSGTSLPPELMYPLISGLSIFETLIVAKATNAPRDIVERIVPYSQAEAQLLAPALSKVLDKYAGAFVSKYGEEAALAALLISMTVQKVSLVREEMERHRPRPVNAPITFPLTPDAPADTPTDGPQA